MEQHLLEMMNRTLKTIDDGGQRHFEHVLTFFSIALQIRAKNILELGTRDGGSTFPLLCASKKLNGKLTSVDIINHPISLPDDLKPYWNFVESDSITYLNNTKEKYDLIYIDDWHAYEHVKKELELIENLIDEKSIVLLHDTMGNVEPNYWKPLSAPHYNEWSNGGVYRALEELNKDKWEWSTIPINHGLTILRKKGKVIIE